MPGKQVWGPWGGAGLVPGSQGEGPTGIRVRGAHTFLPRPCSSRCRPTAHHAGSLSPFEADRAGARGDQAGRRHPGISRFPCSPAGQHRHHLRHPLLPPAGEAGAPQPQPLAARLSPRRRRTRKWPQVLGPRGCPLALPLDLGAPREHREGASVLGPGFFWTSLEAQASGRSPDCARRWKGRRGRLGGWVGAAGNGLGRWPDWQRKQGVQWSWEVPTGST